MHSRLRTVLSTAAVFLLLTAFARADQIYSVSGDDRYSIGGTLDRTDIAYAGTERLRIVAKGPARRYVADVTYTRSDEGGKAIVHARFVQDLQADGNFVDRTDDDPDFLTVLNQPFAVQLDPVTMNDLRHLHGMVPFRALSPFGGAPLRGYLRAAAAGEVQGIPVVGVRFEADGPMDGTLPEHPGAVLAGRMHIDGTAYYGVQGSLLLALDATLTIDGSLHDDHAGGVPVKITYRRRLAPKA